MRQRRAVRAPADRGDRGVGPVAVHQDLRGPEGEQLAAALDAERHELALDEAVLRRVGAAGAELGGRVVRVVAPVVDVRVEHAALWNDDAFQG